MITIKSLDLKNEEVERNTKLAKLKIEEVKLFDELDSQLFKIRKNLLAESKERLIKLLKRYH